MPRSSRVLAISCLVLALAPAVLNAQAGARGNAAVRGTITGAAGRPLAGALVLRLGSADTIRADSAGRYVVDRLPRGAHLITVRHPGYEQVDMQVTFTSDTTITVDVPLEPAGGGAYAGGGAAGGGDKLDRVGFTERRARERRLTFLTAADIAERGVARLSQMFEGVRDVTVRMEGGIPVMFGHDRRCVMNVWLEGRRVDNAFPTSATSGGSRRSSTAVRYTGLDEILPLADVAGVEVYPRPSQVPTAFQSSASVTSSRDFSTTSGECGALVIWGR